MTETLTLRGWGGGGPVLAGREQSTTLWSRFTHSLDGDSGLMEENEQMTSWFFYVGWENRWRRITISNRAQISDGNFCWFRQMQDLRLYHSHPQQSHKRQWKLDKQTKIGCTDLKTMLEVTLIKLLIWENVHVNINTWVSGSSAVSRFYLLNASWSWIIFLQNYKYNSWF